MGNSMTPPIHGKASEDNVLNSVNSNCVVLFTTTKCRHCDDAKELLSENGISYTTYEVDKINHGLDLMKTLRGLTGISTVPQIFINGQCIGGMGELNYLKEKGLLTNLVQRCSHPAFVQQRTLS